MSTLIAYYSHDGENIINNQIVVLKKGNTEIVAEKIRDHLGCDLFKIEALEKYPFNYRECSMRAKRENDNNERPDLLDVVGLDFNKYDTIYLGFPIWYRTYPRIVATFVDKYDFTGKTIIPFCTNDEGYFGIALLELQSHLKNSNIKDGLVIRGSSIDQSDEQIKKFIEKNI